MTNPWLFFLAVLTILATPGPTNTLLASGAAVSGLRNSLMLLTAELFGYLITVDLVGFLLRPVVVAYPVVGSVLKVAVALYLVWAALKLWRKAGKPGAGGDVVGWHTVFTATLLNPKGLIFALGVLPFGQPSLPWFLLAFAAMVPSVGLGWLVAGHLLGAAAGTHRHIVPRIASVVLLGFAGVIAASAFG